MRPTRKIIISVHKDGAASVTWEGAFLLGVCERTLGSQEDAEHFAAGVQAGLISAGLSATVEIVEVGEAVGL